jgi:peptide-methionine (S)-S-oxide reductase
MNRINLFRTAVTSVAAVFFVNACGGEPRNINQDQTMASIPEKNTSIAPQGASIDTATFGAGCFWCVEAIFQRVDGVLSVKSGYAGGTVKNPSYKEVCNGTTGHAEVIQLTYDKNKVSFDELLEVFWKTHDPTTMNRQGNDVGTQYRSAIFYHNAEQKQIAEAYKKKLNEEKVYPSPIVTEITPFTNYFAAENYHQDYYNQNKNQGYCQYVIQPKLEKFEKVFKDKIKK